MAATVDDAMTQRTFDVYAAELATTQRDVGQDRAAAGDPIWFDRATRWIEDLPPGSQFDADDLRDVLGRSGAAGSVFATARKRGWITSVGVGVSRSLTRRRSITRLWERLP